MSNNVVQSVWEFLWQSCCFDCTCNLDGSRTCKESPFDGFEGTFKYKGDAGGLCVLFQMLDWNMYVAHDMVDGGHAIASLGSVKEGHLLWQAGSIIWAFEISHFDLWQQMICLWSIFEPNDSIWPVHEVGIDQRGVLDQTVSCQIYMVLIFQSGVLLTRKTDDYLDWMQVWFQTGF